MERDLSVGMVSFLFLLSYRVRERDDLSGIQGSFSMKKRKDPEDSCTSRYQRFFDLEVDDGNGCVIGVRDVAQPLHDGTE